MAKEDFLGSFLNNPNRARVLRIFAFDQLQSFTLAQAAKRAGVSVHTVQREIRALVRIGIVKEGRPAKPFTEDKKTDKRTIAQKKKLQTWIYNLDLPQARAIARFIYEISPVRYDNIVGALKRTGRVATVILSGTFVGDPSRPADLIVAVDSLNENRLEAAVRKLEPVYGREIRYAAFSTPEFRYRLTVQDRLIRDTLDYPHLILLDRTRLL